ncbi:MAG: hypothetical protein M3Z02_00740, partial [Actinomycetota bacterium]|nr:hypothetical protein [Actinomycetota bacterium]
IVYTTVGAVVAARRRANPIGWLLLGTGVGSAVQLITGEYAMYDRFVLLDRLAGTAVLAWVSQLSVIAVFSLVPFVLLLFPDGGYLSPRWRRVGQVALVALPVEFVVLALKPGEFGNTTGIDNPFGLSFHNPLVDNIENVVGAPMLFLFIAGVVCLVVRWRRAADDQREQFKWVMYAGGVGFGGLFAGTVLASLLPGEQWLGNLGWTVGPALLPAAAGLSILRYRLYDIDRIISRTVGYALVTGLLVVVYVGLVTAVTRLTPGGNSLAVAASTLAVAALFQPLRRRVQAGVDHRFNRSRYDAARTIDAFSSRLRGEVDLTSLQGDLLGVVRRTMQPSSVGLWVRDSPAGLLR